MARCWRARSKASRRTRSRARSPTRLRAGTSAQRRTSHHGRCQRLHRGRRRRPDGAAEDHHRGRSRQRQATRQGSPRPRPAGVDSALARMPHRGRRQQRQSDAGIDRIAVKMLYATLGEIMGTMETEFGAPRRSSGDLIAATDPDRQGRARRPRPRHQGRRPDPAATPLRGDLHRLFQTPETVAAPLLTTMSTRRAVDAVGAHMTLAPFVVEAGPRRGSEIPVILGHRARPRPRGVARGRHQTVPDARRNHVEIADRSPPPSPQRPPTPDRSTRPHAIRPVDPRCPCWNTEPPYLSPRSDRRDLGRSASAHPPAPLGGVDRGRVGRIRGGHSVQLGLDRRAGRQRRHRRRTLRPHHPPARTGTTESTARRTPTTEPSVRR